MECHSLSRDAVDVRASRCGPRQPLRLGPAPQFGPAVAVRATVVRVGAGAPQFGPAVAVRPPVVRVGADAPQFGPAVAVRDSRCAPGDTRGRLAYDRPIEALLLAWYSEHGRDLPWRGTCDPYAILVSEVMLQQTRVERVVPRYLAWLERWPTVDALASAAPAAVIREWQGLGYNRRALSLHRAARHVATHGWPDDLTELPGVGPYTAAAIGCFALGRDVLPVDVNVERVRRRTRAEFSFAAAQALMDLGATVCLARVPRCESCPLASECPSRGVRERPARKQGPFEGSFRQRRAATLRAVADEPRRLEALDTEAVCSLERDGLVVVEGERVTLPA